MLSRLAGAPFEGGYLTLLEDITQRRAAEEALRESERSRALILSHLPGMAYRCRFDPDWTMEFVSEGCVALTGYRPDELIGNRVISFGSVIAPAYRDPVWAEWEKIVARDGREKSVVLGFHPVRTPMRYQLATPLLFANILRWMAPDIFRRWELNAGSVGTVDVDLGQDAAAGRISVRARDGSALPFTQQGQTLRFFTANPGTVRVAAGDRELIYSLTLPEVAEMKWTPPADARRGIPAPVPAHLEYAELWPWLALAGAIGLFAEWFLFGRRRFGLPAGAQTPRSLHAARSAQ
jgi:PAS domain-containing protein